MDTHGYSPDDDRGPLMMGFNYALLAITFIIYGARIATRVYPKFCMTAADYTVTLAMICSTIGVGFVGSAVAHGFGKHTVFISFPDMAIMGTHLFGVYLSTLTASSFARISIACLLLQFTMRRGWRALIWVTIVLQALMTIMYYVVQFAQCTSVISEKLRIQDSRCLTPSHVWGFTYAIVVVAIVSDLICATIPVFVIWRLSRSVLERVLVCILMASSIFATALGIPKLYFMITFDFTSADGFYLMWDEVFWSRMEEAIIIIAACVPLLKSPIERVLHRMGVPAFKVPERELNVISASTGPYDSVKDQDSQTWLPSQRPGSNPSEPEHGTESKRSEKGQGVVSDLEQGSVREPEQAASAWPRSR